MPAGITDETLDSSTGAEILDDKADAVIRDLEDVGAAAADADSSPAQGDEDSSLLGVVRDVVSKSESDTASPAGQPEVKDETQPPVPGQQPSEQDAEFSDVPFNKHPRFRQLVSERNAFRADAERFQNIQSFLRETGLPDDEAADGLVTMAMARTNPVEAWKRVKPWVQSLLVAAGEVLPEDLQSRVGAGEMTRETAIELSRSRATTQSLTQQQRHEQERTAQQRQADLVQGLQNSAAVWEQQARASDPDFEKKLPFIRGEIAARHRGGDMPNTPQGVQQQLKDVYDSVTQQLRAVVPPPRPRRAITPVMGGQVASDARPAPKSTLDVIQQTVERMQAS